MGNKTISDYRYAKEAKGSEIIKCAKKQGAIIEMGKGDHCKVYTPEGKLIETVPLGELHVGILRAIVKALIAAGFICFFLVYGLPLFIK